MFRRHFIYSAYLSLFVLHVDRKRTDKVKLISAARKFYSELSTVVVRDISNSAFGKSILNKSTKRKKMTQINIWLLSAKEEGIISVQSPVHGLCSRHGYLSNPVLTGSDAQITPTQTC